MDYIVRKIGIEIEMTTIKKVTRWVSKIWIRLKNSSNHGYFGNFSSFEEAKNASEGYNHKAIIEKVRNASILARDGKAVFERDGVAFNTRFDWPAATFLESLAQENGNQLHVLDFGGALGSYYYPLAKSFPRIAFEWTIIEQPEFVEIGKKDFESATLHFENSLTETLKQKQFDLVLLGCVLPYLPEPYAVLQEIIQAKPAAILVDKHPVIQSNKDRLTVQRIPPVIYEASYPAWFFSESKFLEFMKTYQLVDSYLCPDICNVNADFKTYFYRRVRNESQGT